MLPTKTSLAIQTDILPTQNIGLIDQNQPQIYSLLGDSDSPIPTKKPRRKKPTDLDRTIPMTMNPQKTGISNGITFTTHLHQRSVSLPDSMSSFITTRFVNDQRLPFRLYFKPDAYDANNNIHSNEIPTLTMSVNTPFSTQVQQIPTYAFPVNNTKSPLIGVNQSLDHTVNETTMSISSLQQNNLFALADQGSQLSHPPSVLPVKPKRKYSKRQNSSISVEQQQTPACPTIFAQPNISNSLPSIIPASVIGMSTKSEEHSLPLDIPTTSNYRPLTPPGSIKSPPVNTPNELPVIPAQQNLLSSFPMNNFVEMNPLSNQYCSSPRHSYPRRIIPDPSYHLHRFLTATPTQYCMIPQNFIAANILPRTYSSVLLDTAVDNPDMRSDSRRQEETIEKSKMIQRPKNELFTSKSLTKDISARKKRNHRNSSKKDMRTKKQLRRMARLNRLAILKYMMRKLKQQKQQSVSTPPPPSQQIKPESVPIPIVKPEEIKTNLPDIIAPSLKISFDPTQKIESIVLYYHRRRKSDLTSENPSKLSNTTDNRLDLLVEAVDYLETQQGHLNLTSCSNQ